MGYVYLICDPATDHYKIGVTRTKDCRRIGELQTGNSTELFVKEVYETPWPFRLETMLHNKYKSKQTLNEWFELSSEDVFEFPKICKILENHIKSLSNNPFFSKNLK